jgi:hypothetical protein
LPSKQSHISLLCWLINLKSSKFKSLIDFFKFGQLRKKHKQKDFLNLNFINLILIFHALKNAEFFLPRFLEKIMHLISLHDDFDKNKMKILTKTNMISKGLYCKIYDYDYSLLVSSATVLYKHKNHHTRRNHTVSHN